MTSTLELLTAAQMAFLQGKPCATMYQTSAQSLGTSNTQITWNSASGDVWGGWSSSSNTRWTVPVAGWYKLETTIQWASSTSGARHVEFYQNGSEILNSLTIIATPQSGQFPQSANPVIVQAAAGDYFQVNTYAGVSGISTTTVSTWTVQFEHF